MKLNEALQLLAGARARPVSKRAVLVCGFEPLHLETFLQAHFAARFPEQRLELEVGLYGDLEGNLARVADSTVDGAALVLEWADLDPRLGLRASAPWSGASSDQIVHDVAQRLERISGLVETLSARMPIAISGPTLPLTYIGSTATGWYSGLELALEQVLSAFLLRAGTRPRVAIARRAELDARSPVSERADPRMELTAGFPYARPHASALAEQLIALLFPAAPKKALITDLDDTLWSGLVGEIGAEQVSWSHAGGAQLHGVYQLVLRQLAELGVLLGAASKNDPEVAAAALTREDLWLDGAKVFPVVASWGPKSEAVSAILARWNLDASDVVFVDDDPMELDEVKRAHPGIEGLLFARNDARHAVALFARLRDLFGRATITDEDRLRAASVRATAQLEDERRGHSDPRAFIRSLQGVVTFRRGREVDVPRALQLLNKTNQFNLNGRRVTEHELIEWLAGERGFVLECDYSDRFGPLGIIACVAGRLEAERVSVQSWVLSCRAFSRRIEHRIAHELLALAGERELVLDYARTDRNGPMRAFLQELGVLPEVARGPVRIPAGTAVLDDSPGAGDG